MKGQFVKGAAKALYHLDGDTETVNKRQHALDEIATALNASNDLENLLNTPFIPMDKRMGLLKEIVKEIPDEIENLVKFAFSKRKAHLLPMIAKAYKNLHENKLEVEVISTSPLNETEKDAILKKLAEAAQKPITLIERIDPSLLGGFKLIFSNKMLDMSIAGASNDLKQFILR